MAIAFIVVPLHNSRLRYDSKRRPSGRKRKRLAKMAKKQFRNSLNRLSRYVFTISDERFVAGVSLFALVLLCGWLAVSYHLGGGCSGLDATELGNLQFRVHVGEADWPELAQLPQIGPVLARRIVEHRQSMPRIRSLDDLQQVRGIGPLTAQRISPYLHLPATSESQGGP